MNKAQRQPRGDARPLAERRRRRCGPQAGRAGVSLGRSLLLTLAALLLGLASAGAKMQLQWLRRDRGLPSTQVHSVAQDGAGLIWVAGPNGLSRYDGVRLTTFGLSDGLSAQGSRALVADAEGRLWIGTDVGVDVREADGSFHPLVEADAWEHGFVDALDLDLEGTLWIAAARGLLRWRPEEGLSVVPRTEGHLFTTVVSDGRGSAWAAGPGCGLLRLAGGTWSAPAWDAWQEVAPLRVLAPGAGGSLLIGGDGGLLEVDAGGRVRHRLVDAAHSSMVTSILELGDELWLGISGELRLYRRSPEGWQFQELVLAGSDINQMVVDQQGNVWIATDSAGLAKAAALRHAVRQLPAPCPTAVYSIALTPSGDWLFGGDRCSWRARAGDFQPVASLSHLDAIKVWDLLEDAAGTVWAATERGLISWRPGGRAEKVTLGSAILEAPGRVLLARAGSLWVGTVTGLVEIRGGEAREVELPGGTSVGYVYTLVEAPDGRLWVGTIGSGLWREAADGSLHRVGISSLSQRANVPAVAFGPSGQQAILADRDALLVAGEEVRMLQETGVDQMAGWAALFDGEGRLWVGSGSGLVRYDLGGEAPLLRVTESMGLPGLEFTTSRSLARAGAGRLLVGLERGAAVVDVDRLLADWSQPEVGVVEIHWSAVTPRKAEAGTEVSPGRWTLEAIPSAPWFLDEQSLRLRHRLVGFDGQWSAPQPAWGYRIHYTALPPGDYTVEAQAYSPLTGWGPPAPLLAFQVTSYWFLRPWALLLWLLLLLALMALAARWRTRVLVKRTRELEQRVAQRTAELQEVLASAERRALLDDLTGLANHRAFWEAMRRLESTARRRAEPFALVALDLDDFKRINDRHGHRAGDEVLVRVTRTLSQVARDEDVLARYGGEEFVLLAARASEPDAASAAGRMQAALREASYEIPEAGAIRVTASFGVSAWGGSEDDVEALFRRADAALYAAKRSKDRVMRWSELAGEERRGSPRAEEVQAEASPSVEPAGE